MPMVIVEPSSRAGVIVKADPVVSCRAELIGGDVVVAVVLWRVRGVVKTGNWTAVFG